MGVRWWKKVRKNIHPTLALPLLGRKIEGEGIIEELNVKPRGEFNISLSFEEREGERSETRRHGITKVIMVDLSF